VKVLEIVIATIEQSLRALGREPVQIEATL
jgi:hypothetical protein